jgi:hypothetical protein
MKKRRGFRPIIFFPFLIDLLPHQRQRMQQPSYQPVPSVDPSTQPDTEQSQLLSPTTTHAQDGPFLEEYDPTEEDLRDQEDQPTADADGPATIATATTTTTGLPASSSSSSLPPMAMDGVFANVTAKPEPPKQASSDVELPAYATVAEDSVPPYPVVIMHSTDAGETPDQIIVDGLPVGNGFAFVFAALLTVSFQFVGFLVAYLLSMSHAGKLGALSGMGFVLINYGMILSTNRVQYEYDDQSGEYVARERSASSGDQGYSDVIVSYILMVVGWFMVIRSLTEMIRIRRTQQLMILSLGSNSGEAQV